MEIQKDVSAMSTKTERLIVDLGALTTKLEKVSETLQWAKGFAVAAIILVPICGTIIWWMVGSKLEQVRDEILGVKTAVMSDQMKPGK